MPHSPPDGAPPNGALPHGALPHGPVIAPGGPVAVRSRFDGRWCSGFEIDDVVDEPAAGISGYRLRRQSDGQILPAVFPIEDIIPDRG